MEPTLLAMTAHEQRELVAGIVSAGTGVLIFLLPALLNYIVAGYLVVVGAILIVSALN
jgi:hypothetical protein